MDIEQLVREVAGHLGAHYDRRGQTHYLTVQTAGGDGRGDSDSRTQLVSVDMTEDEEHVLVGSDVGPFSDALRMGKPLRKMGNAIYSRLYVKEGDGRGDEEKLAIEAGVALHGLNEHRLVAIVQEVAKMADKIEAMMFGTDDA